MVRVNHLHFEDYGHVHQHFSENSFWIYQRYWHIDIHTWKYQWCNHWCHKHSEFYLQCHLQNVHRCPMDCPHKGPTMRNISLALIGQCNAFKTRHSSLLIKYDDIYIMLNCYNSACQHRLCIMVTSLHARPGIYIHQQFYCLFNCVWANIPQNIKTPHYWSFVRGVNSAQWNPHTQGQQGGKLNIYKTLQQIWTKYSLNLTAVKYSTILDPGH